MVILPDAVEAAERARPVVPSATHAAGATDQPSGSAAVSAVPVGRDARAEGCGLDEERECAWTAANLEVIAVTTHSASRGRFVERSAIGQDVTTVTLPTVL